MKYVLYEDYDSYEDGRYTFQCGSTGTGAPTVRLDDFLEIEEWCEGRFGASTPFSGGPSPGGRWFFMFEDHYPSFFLISFEHEEDAIAFRNRWVVMKAED